MMKRNGAKLMRKWEERQQMCGRWTKRNRRIFMRLRKEVSKKKRELNVVEELRGRDRMVKMSD